MEQTRPVRARAPVHRPAPPPARGRLGRRRCAVLLLAVLAVSVGLSAISVRQASAVPFRPNGPQGQEGTPESLTPTGNVQSKAAAQNTRATSPITSAQIMANAWNWYIANGNPPYSSSNYWENRTDYWGDAHGDNPQPGSAPVWRQDCSGFASHAWGFVSSGGGFSTYTVGYYSYPISWSQLQPGDALLLNGVSIDGTIYDHMGLFVGWQNATTYEVMDETGPGSGTQLQTGIPLGDDGFWQYAQPIRYAGTVVPAGPLPGPRLAVRTTGEVDTVAEGPDNQLDYSWAFSDQQFNGPLDVGAAYASPAIAVRPTGEVDIVAEGSFGEIQYYWAFPGQGFLGPVNIGTTLSAPAITVRASGEVDIVAQGSGGQLDYYWAFPGSPFFGPVVLGTAASSPSLTVRSTGEVDVVAQSSGGQLAYYWAFPGSSFFGPLDVGPAYSAPSLVVRSTGEADVVTEGPEEQLDYYWAFPGGPFYSALDVGSALSAPSLAVRGTGEADMVAAGLNDQFDYYWVFPYSSVQGPTVFG